ncbi:MAG: hypothetical protein IT367_17650 [Candidatus Hydrogenedentes bacterium]|nr:hypothetical protein [Candidatus Hydrogenedentota bacterium]
MNRYGSTIGRLFLLSIGLLPAAVAEDVSWKEKAAVHLLDQTREPAMNPADVNDHLVADLTSLGGDIVPPLLDMLRKPPADAARPYRERLKQEIIARSLARIQDPRIVPGIKDILQTRRDESWPAKGPLIAALMAQVRTAEMDAWVLDYIRQLPGSQTTEVDENSTQDAVLEGLTGRRGRELAVDITRLLPGFDGYAQGAQIEIIRALGRWRNADALLRITRDHADDQTVAGCAVNELAQLSWSTACSDLRDLLLTSPKALKSDILLIMADRHCDAITEYEALRDQSGGEEFYTESIRATAAAALCALGKDYDQNAQIVRECLNAAKLRTLRASLLRWLHDDDTAKWVLEMYRRENRYVPYGEISAVGHRMFLPLLEDRLLSAHPEEFGHIGEAIESVGYQNRDSELVSRGQAVRKISRLQLYIVPWNSPTYIDDEQWRQDARGAARWLAANPKIAIHMLESLMSGRNAQDTRREIQWNVLVPLLDVFWQDEMIPLIEHEIEVNDEQVTRVDREKKTYTPTYSTRSFLAGYLNYKTGKKYTFIDVDGVRKNGQIWVRSINPLDGILGSG